MMMWPENRSQTVDFEHLVASVRQSLEFAYDLTRKNKNRNVPYDGYNIGRLDLANCFSPVERFKRGNLKYSLEEQGRDALDEILGVAIQLGIEQGRRCAYRECGDFAMADTYRSLVTYYMEKEEELKKKHVYNYPMQSVTADCVVFVGDEVLLVKRNTEPFKNRWALPGGHLDPEDANTKETADRELLEETGVDVTSDIVLQQGQVDVYDEIGRDPRGRYVTVAYFYILKEKPKITIQEDEVKDAKWFKVDDVKVKDMAFDHYKILDHAAWYLDQKESQ